MSDNDFSNEELAAPEGVKEVHSILDVNFDDLTSPVKFTEESTIKALKLVGATPQELVRRDISEIPGSPETRQTIYDDLEIRRAKTISAVIKMREVLIKEDEKQPKHSSAPKKGNNKQASHSQRIHKKPLPPLPEIGADGKRRDEKLSSRSNHSDFKSTCTSTLSTSRQIANAQTDAEKMELLTKEREEEREKENEEMKELEQLLENAEEDEKEKIQDEIDDLNARIQDNEDIYNQKMDMLKKAESQKKFLNRVAAMPGATQFSSYKRRLEDHIINYQEISAKQMQQNQMLKKSFRARDRKIATNLQAINYKRQERLIKNKLELQQRSKYAAETKQLLEKEKLAKCQKDFQREQAAYQRAMGIKAAMANRIYEKADETLARKRNAAGNSNHNPVKA